MGWGTDFKANVYLNKITFSSKYDVEYKISELKEDIITLEKLILGWCHANPIRDEEEILDTDTITFRLNQKFEEYRELLRTLTLVELYLEHYDEQISNKN